MIIQHPIAIVLFVLFIAFSNKTNSQIIDPRVSSATSNFSIKHWTTANGLPSNALNDIFQASDDYIYLSSYEGIIRFDGFKFKILNTSNTEEFRTNTFGYFAETNDSTIWVNSEGAHFGLTKKGITIADSTFNNNYTIIRNKLWKTRTKTYEIDTNNGTLCFKTLDTVFTYTRVRDLLRINSKSILFATNKGVFHLEGQKLKHYTQSDGLKEESSQCLFVDSSNTIWIGTRSGLFYLKNEKITEDLGFNGVNINRIIIDNVGNHWLSSIKGLFQKEKETGKISLFNTQNGLPVNYTELVFVDKENNIWCHPIRNGLIQIKRKKFKTYDKTLGLEGKVVNTIQEYPNNQIIVGFENGSTQIIGKNTQSILQTQKNIKGTRIRHVFVDSKKNIWISTYEGLVVKYSSGKEKWFSTHTGFPSRLIRIAYEDSKGNVWVGTRDIGLIKFSPNGTWKLIGRAGLKSDLVMTIEENAKNELIVGTSPGGVSILKNDTVIQQYTVNNDLASDVVFNTYTDEQGVLWAATNGGLSRIHNQQVTSYKVKNGLASNSPYDITEDNSGNLWLPFPLGIMKINKKVLNNYAEKRTKTISVKTYDRYDGLPVDGFTPIAQTLKTKKGQLWFPSLNGLVTANPDNIVSNSHIPKVHLEKVLTDDKFVDLDSKISVEPHIQRISFQYTAICHQEPEKLRFRYILEGYDEYWTETSSERRSTSYTNLPYGQYTFRVIASNNDGVWNKEGARIQFYVEPLWFETITFRVFAVFSSLLIFGLLYVLRVTHLKQRQRELEELIRIRTKEILEQNYQLSELNATKDKFFNIIAHDLKNPFSSILGFSELLKEGIGKASIEQIQRYITHIHSVSKETYQLLENLLTWAQSQTGTIEFQAERFNLKELTEGVISLSEHMAKNKSIQVEYIIPQDLEILADVNMISTILRNLITNSLKFTPKGGSVRITALTNNKETEISVTDTGVGISKNLQKKLFKMNEKISEKGTDNEKGTGLGLLLCKEFVEQHKGKIWIKSQIGKGSTFTFTIPH